MESDKRMNEYESVQKQHADRIAIEEGKLVIMNNWNKNKAIDKCEKFECSKKSTHLVSWNTPRFYGFKKCLSAFCEKHAKEWFQYLKKDSETATQITLTSIEVKLDSE